MNTTLSIGFANKREDQSNSDNSQDRAETRPYLQSLVRRRLLTSEEEISLSRRALKGDKRAKDMLVESNERLVLDVARKFQTASMPLEDLFQEGVIGLVRAVERFDPERGLRFSTFAIHWIRQSILRAIEIKSKSIRIPSHITDSLRKLEKTREEMTLEMGVEPSDEQLSERVGFSMQKIESLMRTGMEPLSLDNLVGEDGDTPLSSLLSDENAVDPLQSAISHERQKMLDDLLSNLSPREEEVLRCRFAMEGDSSHILQQIGAKLHLSRERVRQIELQAIRKLHYVARRQNYLAFDCE